MRQTARKPGYTGCPVCKMKDVEIAELRAELGRLTPPDEPDNCPCPHCKARRKKARRDAKEVKS